jgi:hypothetical protein
MRQQQSKKLRKEYRKQVNEYLEHQGLLELFQLIVKPKPKWVPKRLWIWGIKRFINVQEDWKYAGN